LALFAAVAADSTGSMSGQEPWHSGQQHCVAGSLVSQFLSTHQTVLATACGTSRRNSKIGMRRLLSKLS
jgi:hypothetical protein